MVLKVNYFLGNQGIKILVFSLYSFRFIFFDCNFSFIGTPEAKSNTVNIVINHIILYKFILNHIILNHNQKTLSQK